MERIHTHIECYLQYIYHKHFHSAYIDEDEFKYVATNWDNEYNFVTWFSLFQKISSLLTPHNICMMIRAIQAYYGDDPAVKNVYLELTPDLVLLHYVYCTVRKMNLEQITSIVKT